MTGARLASGEVGEFGRLALDHRRDRGRRDVDAVEVVQELGDAILRQQLHGRQIGDHRRDVVLNRSRHRLGERRPRPAVPAAAFVSAVLGHQERLRKVEYLAALMADRIGHAQSFATTRTASRQDDGVGMLRSVLPGCPF